MWNVYLEGNQTLIIIAAVVVGYALVIAGILIAYKAINRRWEIVRTNSVYYQNVLRINEETIYTPSIGKNGVVEYIRYANSKAQFDRIQPEDAFYEYLVTHRSEIMNLLDAVSANRRAYNVYIARYEACASEITPEKCKELRIGYQKFREIEEKLVAAQKLEIIRELVIASYVQYTSPQGRNHYSKHCDYLESEIRVALRKCEEQAQTRATEAYRRKNERAKATPALRYEIMRRDGFRCCLCGRSAQQGVELEVDHIVPVSRGGSTTPENLQTLCRDCNRGKGAKM